jgi:hypothetical protein
MPRAGALERYQGRILFEVSDQCRFDAIGMEGSIDRQYGAGQSRQRQTPRPVVGTIHGIEDKTVSRRAGTGFPTPTFFRINDRRHLKTLKHSQSGVVGRKIE